MEQQPTEQNTDKLSSGLLAANPLTHALSPNTNACVQKVPMGRNARHSDKLQYYQLGLLGQPYLALLQVFALGDKALASEAASDRAHDQRIHRHKQQAYLQIAALSTTSLLIPFELLAGVCTG